MPIEQSITASTIKRKEENTGTIIPIIIGSINVNSWLSVSGHKYTYTERISMIHKQFPNSPDVIFLQEYFTGRWNEVKHDCVHLATLKQYFKEYEIVTPKGFDLKNHPQTLTSITLLKRDRFTNIQPFDSGATLANRICVTKANLNGNHLPLFIINYYGINPEGRSNSHFDRPTLRKQHNEDLVNLASKARGCATIIGGDFNPNNNDIIDRLKELNYIEPISNISICDHILYSPIADYMFHPKTLTIDTALTGIITDHPVLIAST